MVVLLAGLGGASDVPSSVPALGNTVAADSSSEFQFMLQDPDGFVLRPRMTLRLNDGMNLQTYSTIFDTGEWTLSDVTIVGTEATQPVIGSGRKFESSTAVQWSAELTGPTLGVLDYEVDQKLTLSVLFKYHLSSSFLIMLYDVTGATQFYTYANFTGTVPALGSGFHDGAGVIDVGDGYYRLWVHVDLRARGRDGHEWKVRIFPAGNLAVSGTGTTVAHVQVERNRDLYGGAPTSFIESVEEPLFALPGTAIVLNNDEHQIALNPIVVKRERNFGTVQSQDWAATFTHESLGLFGSDLVGCWIALEAGFPDSDLDEWILLAQGLVKTAKATTDLKVSFSMKDQLRGSLERELEQDYRFDSVAWVGDITAVTTSEGSDDYNNDWDDTETKRAITLGIFIAQIVGGVYNIEFTAATTYTLTWPNGWVQTGMTITSDQDILLAGDGGPPGVGVIWSDGWNQDVDAYSTGDKFSFPGSGELPANQLTPAFMIYSLLFGGSGFLNLKCYNVLAGIWYPTIFDDIDQWAVAFTTYNTFNTRGTFEKGTEYIDIIQMLLRVIHGSVYTTPTGLIALWEFLPVEADPLLLNGDPDFGAVQIELGEVEDNQKDIANVITYLYKTIGGNHKDASYTARDEDSISRFGELPRIVDLRPLEVNSTGIISAADRLLARSKDNRKKYKLTTTLASTVLTVSDAIGINEPSLGLAQQRAEVTQTELDVFGQRIRISSHVEPIVLDAYAKVGNANTDPVGDVVGGTKKVW